MLFVRKISMLVSFWANAVSILSQTNYDIANMQRESLDRGVVAIRNAEKSVTISWRYLPEDQLDIAFDIFRSIGNKKATKINSSPIIKSTFFVDSIAEAKNDLTYSIRRTSDNKILGQYKLTYEKSLKPYIEIPMNQIDGDINWSYSPNDASAGDLDGDGQYEIVIKREARNHDNSHRGITDPTYLEAYKLDGTLLWSVNLGVNIRSGAHYTPFIVYDFDGDGCAEVAVRTSEGTIFSNGMQIADTDGDGIVDYVDRDEKSKTYGMIVSGPEFLSVIDGKTGRELARTQYISREPQGSYGDNHGNRQDRFLAGVAYIDGLRPTMIFCRGYYARTVIKAWNFRGNQLQEVWTFDTFANDAEYESFGGQGNHNLSIGDTDGDGKDEIVYGAFQLDHNGLPSYNTNLGHGDAIHLTDINIDHPGLEVWDCHESVPTRAGSEMRDARTGELLWGVPAIEDVGRALTADIDPRFRGCEAWALNERAVFTADGKFISQEMPSINFAIWWDGDLNRELLDGSARPGDERAEITKWNGDGIDRIKVNGFDEATCNNWSKGTPCLQADLFGDWREEVVLRTKDNKFLRIFMTDYPTEYRFHSLMTDHIYRVGIALQNVGYNQPPHTGFYLGSDLGKFARTEYRQKHGSHADGKSGRARNGRPNGMHERVRDAEVVTIDTLIVKHKTITLDTGCDYEKIEWKIGDKVIGNERFVTINKSDLPSDKITEISISAIRHGAKFEGNLYLKIENQ